MSGRRWLAMVPLVIGLESTFSALLARSWVLPVVAGICGLASV
jgi:hypothetical protein